MKKLLLIAAMLFGSVLQADDVKKVSLGSFSESHVLSAVRNTLDGLGVEYSTFCTKRKYLIVGPCVRMRASAKVPSSLRIITKRIVVSPNLSGSSTYSGAAQAKANAALKIMQRISQHVNADSVPNFKIIFNVDGEELEKLPHDAGFVDEVSIEFE